MVWIAEHPGQGRVKSEGLSGLDILYSPWSGKSEGTAQCLSFTTNEYSMTE